LSWQATSYVKTLKIAQDGSAVTRSEKLLLLILADYHNTEQKAAWPSANTLAVDTLLTVRHVRRVLASVKKKGVLCTSQRLHTDGHFDSNLYHFHALDCSQDHKGGSDIVSLPGGDIRSVRSDARVTRGSDIVSPHSDAQTTVVVTPDAQPSLYEDQSQPSVEEPHTGTTQPPEAPPAENRVCVKSKFSLETIRRYAWASHHFDSRWNKSRPGEKIDGIRNPEGWSIAAHRSGTFDELIAEYQANPEMFEVSVAKY
jgi:hypothetical protein